MLRAMVLIVLAVLLLVTIVTQIVMPMFIDRLSFFWVFKKGSRDDILTIGDDDKPAPSLYKQAYDAKKTYRKVKGEIREQKDKLDRLDKATDV